MISHRLRQLLTSEHVAYRTLPHEVEYDAQRTAAAAHVRGREFAKTVVLRADGRLCMAVLPASDQVDLEALRRAMGAHELELAGEPEMERAFPDCETGAMPPIGELYGMDVFVSPHLREDEEIAFNGGCHDELVLMRYGDFERLAHPSPLRF